MRINDKSLSGVDQVAEVSAKQPKPATVTVTEQTGSFVKVKVSPASQAASVSASLSAQTRANKVAQIAQAVRAGGYPIDLDRLAKAIASDELARMS